MQHLLYKVNHSSLKAAKPCSGQQFQILGWTFFYPIQGALWLHTDLRVDTASTLTCEALFGKEVCPQPHYRCPECSLNTKRYGKTETDKPWERKLSLTNKHQWREDSSSSKTLTSVAKRRLKLLRSDWFGQFKPYSFRSPKFWILLDSACFMKETPRIHKVLACSLCVIMTTISDSLCLWPRYPLRIHPGGQEYTPALITPYLWFLWPFYC